MLLLLKNLLFTVLVPGSVGVYAPLLIIDDRPAASRAVFAAGCLLLLLGTCIYGWCVWDFASFGRGTPAPIDAPKRLVVRGLYHYTRNPMYVGVLTVILGWATLFACPPVVFYAACVWMVFHLFIRLYEEPHLAGEFGGEYEAYRERVGRWLPRSGRG